MLKGLTPADLTLISAEAGLDFAHATQPGAVFHLMGTLSMLGKVGVTCIADSLEAARSMYKRREAAVLGAQEAAASAELRRRLQPDERALCNLGECSDGLDCCRL